MLFVTFHEDWAKTLYTEAYKRILLHYGVRMEYLVSSFEIYLNCTKCNEIDVIFCYAQKYEIN